MRSKKNASALPAELLMSQLTCQPKLVVLMWPSGTQVDMIVSHSSPSVVVYRVVV